MSNNIKPEVGQIWVQSASFRCQYDTFNIITRVSEKSVWFMPCDIDGKLRFRATNQMCRIENAKHELGELLIPELCLEIKAKMQQQTFRSDIRDYCEKITKLLYNSGKVKLSVTADQVRQIQSIYDDLIKQQADANANL
jgi:hypothetical protein